MLNFIRFNRKTLSIVLVLCLSMIILAAPIYAGSIKNPGAGGEPGTWFIGETPVNVDPNKPVILFVQGLNSSASTWYENNDMYVTAYQNGYQTAFVELYDSGGTSKSMWDNGRLLADLIEEIYQHFGKKLVLVTHSKGGVDSQTALVHYQAYPYVSNVITLGSPHYGSELADLAYSSWAWWLAAILGQRSDGTYSMQTSYMEYFRTITDHHVNANKNKFYTLAGTKWGSFGSALYWSGLYLSQYGTNDGVVVVNRAYVPGGTMVKVGSWNHNEIKYGSKTFSWFSPYLTLSQATKESYLKAAGEEGNEVVSGVEVLPKISMPDQYIHGGEFTKEVTPAFMVEDGVKSITVDFISAYPLDNLELVHAADSIAPAKNVKIEKHEAFQVFQDTSFFNKAWHHSIVLKNPQPGEWRLQAKSSNENAYLLHVQYDSKLSKEFKLQKASNKNSKSNSPSHAVQFNIDNDVVKAQQVKLSYQVDYIPNAKTQPKKVIEEKNMNIIQQGTTLSFAKDLQPGIYNMTINLQGKTASGAPFNRTIIQSIYIDDKGQLFSSLK